MEAAVALLTPPSSGVTTDVLSFAVEARQRSLRAEADLLLGALRWAQLHEVETPEDPRDPWAVAAEYVGQGRSMPLAGEGTPWVEEFAVPELAAALGLTEQAAVRLVGDALELAYRLPLTWSRIQSGELPAWRGRAVAERTRSLSGEAAGWVDRQVAPFAHRLSAGRLRDLIDSALLRFDLTDPDRRDPAEARGVDFAPVGGGQVYLRALLDVVDGRALAATVDEVAASLRRLGDDSELPVRRSRALGLLADPQLTLDVLSGTPTTSQGATRSPSADLTLYVHVSAEELAAGVGVARVEGQGPVSLARVREWAAKTRLTVRPVLDLADEIVVDAYEIPARLREQVLARDPVCVFPWCGARTHRRDIDHVIAFDATGPPGQTRSSNLAPLCRLHHRLKTHGKWVYVRDDHGCYQWRSPLGREYTVTHQGTSTA